MAAFSIQAQGSDFTAQPLWSNKDGGGRFSTAVLKDGLLYCYNNQLLCIDAKTGATCWTDTVKRGNNAAIVDAGPILVATCVNSELVVFKPDGKQYTELARIKIGGSEIWAHPVLGGNKIFVRDADNVALFTLD